MSPQPILLLWCISFTITSSMIIDQNGYLDMDCRQLQREYPDLKCFETSEQPAYAIDTVDQPAYAVDMVEMPRFKGDLQLYKAKRATRAKIRQILVDSYLNRMG